MANCSAQQMARMERIEIGRMRPLYRANRAVAGFPEQPAIHGCHGRKLSGGRLSLILIEKQQAALENHIRCTGSGYGDQGLEAVSGQFHNLTKKARVDHNHDVEELEEMDIISYMVARGNRTNPCSPVSFPTSDSSLMKPHTVSTVSALLMFCLMLPCRAADAPQTSVPDLTKGGKLTRINERWAGPIGIHCGMWRPGRGDKTEDVRQLQVLAVDKGSPADGLLQVDDVILGADGTGAATVPLFQGSSIWPMVPIAEAITEAEARDPALLKLLVWSKGTTKTVAIKLESLGRYSETAPYNCPKSKNILRKGIKALYEENKFDESGLGVLCLLAADDPTNPDNDKYQAKAKEWVHKLEVGGAPWYSGPKLMALSEYYMKTKDETIFPKLVAQAEHQAKGVSWFGTAGHKWSDKREDGSDNGRLSGYGPITASGTLGYLGLSMARMAGVKSPAVEASHRAQRIFFGHYAFKSGMGYGEHAYGIGDEGDDYNAKQANSGLAIGIDEGRVDKAKYFCRKATLASMDKRQYAHGGSFFGQVFHPLGAVQGGEKAANLQFKEIRWHLDLKRRWNHTRIYDGTGNAYNGFHWGSTALIFYAAPLKQIYLTGKGQKDSLKFTDAEFQEILQIKNFDATKASIPALIAALSSHQGLLRAPAGTELARRTLEKPEAPEWTPLIDQLLVLAADEKNPSYGRAGACFALMLIKDKSAEPVKSMKNSEIAKTMIGLLKSQDAYVRFAGVRVLQKLDPAVVRSHGNTILDAILATTRPTFPLDEEDPLQWAHGIMGELLNSVFSKNLDGLDRAKLIPAMRSLLDTPDGGSRGVITNLLSKLTKEETMEVADLLVDNIRTLPPGNAMGGPAATLNSQTALAKFMFEEALPLSATYGASGAIKNGIPQKYGKAALQLDSAEDFLQALGDQILIDASDVQAVADGLEKGPAPTELLKLKRINSVKAENKVLKLPAAETKLIVDAINFGRRGENETIYTWRKIHGAGKVGFKPNKSGQSKTTTVTFTDKKPGNYRFEVTMSDTLGLNVVRETVTVDLYDPSGKIPNNTPPQTKPQTIETTAGVPTPVYLSGTDSDGDDLGFIVTVQPLFGKLTDAEGRPVAMLSAVDGPLTYTAKFGHKGKDHLTFMAMDGQGKNAVGTVDFNVSDKGVGVAVYEGFDYPEGNIHGKDGDKSFGFAGPWQGSRAEGTSYQVQLNTLPNTKSASLSHPNLPSSGGRLTGQRHATLTRALDPKALTAHKLLDNGGELWFSVFVEKPNLTFELRGPDFGLGFGTTSHKYRIYATSKGEEAGTARNAYTRSGQLRFPDGKASMIVGRFVWGKTDADPDKLTIHRVYDAPGFGPLFLENPVCVLEQTVDQKTMNSIFLGLDSNIMADEIRIGPSLSSVMVGTEPQH